MLPRSHSYPPRRRSGIAPQLCAAAAALLLLLSLVVLHSRLSSSSSSTFPLSISNANSNSIAFLADDEASLDPILITNAATSNPNSDEDRIDELDVLDEDTSSGVAAAEVAGAASSLIWDHAAGVARLPFRLPTSGDPLSGPHLDIPRQQDQRGSAAGVFGSDDEPVDLELRVEISSIGSVEDALLLKTAGTSLGEVRLRAKWARWLEGKADYLRRDRMFRSNLEVLNPRNHPLLQDPDGPGVTFLTRGDRLIQRMLLAEIEKSSPRKLERRSLQSSEQKQEKISVKEEKVEKEKIGEEDKARRWGYFPGINSHLNFSEFVERFFEYGKCSTRVFMVWNSPQWTFGIRNQRGLESLLRQHPDACVMMLSETLELEFFREFVKEGYKVSVAVPNLDELLKGTPTHIFASVWFEWRKTKHYPLHYSELVRLAALYKYGGIYLDSDVIVLKPLHTLHNSIGVGKQIYGNSTFSGAVLAFEKQSPFIMECLKEFYSTYDETLLQWNGADLMTRVMNDLSSRAGEMGGHLDIKIEPPNVFFPISSTNISRYFSEPDDEIERVRHDALFSKIVNGSITFHLWNSLTSPLVPEPKSLVERILNHYCLHCLDVL